MQTGNKQSSSPASLQRRTQTSSSLLPAYHWQQWEGAWPLCSNATPFGRSEEFVTQVNGGTLWWDLWWGHSRNVFTRISNLLCKAGRGLQRQHSLWPQLYMMFSRNQGDKAKIPITSHHPWEFLRPTLPIFGRRIAHFCFWWKEILDDQTSLRSVSKTAQWHSTWFSGDPDFSSVNAKVFLQLELSCCYLKI